MVRFAGGTGAEELLRAVQILTELYASGARKVPADAPSGFVPARWAGYLDAAAAAGDVTGYRHYWELCVLLGLRDGLRSGDVHVPGSRRYADPGVVPAHARAMGAAAGGVLPAGRQARCRGRRPRRGRRGVGRRPGRSRRAPGRGPCELAYAGEGAVGRRYHENVHFYGTHTVDVDRELAKLDAGDSGSDEQAKLAAFNPARLLVGPGGRQGGGLQARSPARVQRTPVWRDKVSLLSDFGGTPGPRGGASRRVGETT